MGVVGVGDWHSIPHLEGLERAGLEAEDCLLSFEALELTWEAIWGAMKWVKWVEWCVVWWSAILSRHGLKGSRPALVVLIQMDVALDSIRVCIFEPDLNCKELLAVVHEE
jgi:hypothetical protein